MGSQSDTRASKRQALEQALKEWWERKNEAWEADTEDDSIEGDDLWHHMPVIDSKVVTRAAPIFENHLDIELDLKMIQEGGYDSIEDLINHLVPQMIDEVQKTKK